MHKYLILFAHSIVFEHIDVMSYFESSYFCESLYYYSNKEKFYAKVIYLICVYAVFSNKKFISNQVFLYLIHSQRLKDPCMLY